MLSNFHIPLDSLLKSASIYMLYRVDKLQPAKSYVKDPAWHTLPHKP